jgi:hypothetical protein
MNSGTSTSPPRAGRGGSGGGSGDDGAAFQPWHFYVLASMAAATVGVMLSKHTHPVALLLLSAAIVAAGLVGLLAHRALAAFSGDAGVELVPIDRKKRDTLLREKQLALHAIKELEFDRQMGKVSDRDYQTLLGPLRARALVLMRDLDRASGNYREQIERDVRDRIGPDAAALGLACAGCGTRNDADARFCKTCGRELAA